MLTCSRMGGPGWEGGQKGGGGRARAVPGSQTGLKRAVGHPRAGSVCQTRAAQGLPLCRGEAPACMAAHAPTCLRLMRPPHMRCTATFSFSACSRAVYCNPGGQPGGQEGGRLRESAGRWRWKLDYQAPPPACTMMRKYLDCPGSLEGPLMSGGARVFSITMLCSRGRRVWDVGGRGWRGARLARCVAEGGRQGGRAPLHKASLPCTNVPRLPRSGSVAKGTGQGAMVQHALANVG